MSSIDLQAKEIKPTRNTYTHVARYIGGDKPATRYQEATMGAQPTQNFHYRPTWDPQYELFDASRSAVKLADWYVLKDPRQYYYATWTMARARQQEAVEANYQFVDSRGLMARMTDEVRAIACQVLMPLRHVAWAGNMNNCFIAAYGYGTALTAATTFHSMDQLGIAQYLTRLGLAVDEPGVLDALFAELGDGHGDARLHVHIGQFKNAFADKDDIQYRARQLPEDVAIALQAKLLLEAGNATVSDAFIASRLGHGGRVYGTLPRGLDVTALLARSAAHLS